MDQATTQPPFGTYAPPTAAQVLLWLSRHSFLGRGKFRQWVYATLKTLHDGPVDTYFWGAPIRIDPRTNLVERKPLLRVDRVDVEERAIMHRFLDKQDAVFVDIGANMGLYTFDAVINGRTGVKVIAIEPQPAMVERLTFNLETMRLNKVRGTENITLFPVAVGAEETTANFAIDGPEHMNRISKSGGAQVRVRPLVNILNDADIHHIDCLKIDIEGYEGDALGPFLREAPDHLLPRCVLIEHGTQGQWSEDIFGLLTKRGFFEANRFDLNAAWINNKPTQSS